VRDAAPGRVLLLSVVAWGLGELAMGRRYVGSGWLLAEAIGMALVALATFLLADTTWYLVPFLAGMAFIAVWVLQAVAAYRRAQRLQRGATSTTPGRSPAAAATWLTVPLLVWGTGFWLFAAEAASPAAVLDRFVGAWSQIADGAHDANLAQDPVALSGAAAEAVARLGQLCAAGSLPDDCADAPENLLRDVRFRLEASDDGSASAVAELVRYERRPARFVGLFEATELVPIPVEAILRLDLAALPAALGSERWTVVNAGLP
jgi:hypothetical protein